MVSDWYDYPSNYSNGLEVNGTGSFIHYTSFTTNNYLAYGFLFMIWIFIFGVTTLSGTKKALTVSSFIAFIFSVYFVRMEIMTPLISLGLILLTIIGLIGVKEENNY